MRVKGTVKLDATIESIAQIVDNTKAVANAAKNTTYGAEETNEAAQKLSKMATELRELVSQFKYESNGANGHAKVHEGMPN